MAKFTKSYNVESGVFTGTHESGEVVEVSLDSLPASIVRQLALHGLSQKIGDSISGKDVVGEVAVATVNAVITNLTEGRFNLSGGGNGSGGIVVEAIARLMNKPLEDAAAFWTGQDDLTQAQLRKHADIKAMVNVIKGERAAAQVQSSTLFG